jgi:hypothetical protein
MIFFMSISFRTVTVSHPKTIGIIIKRIVCENIFCDASLFIDDKFPPLSD